MSVVIDFWKKPINNFVRNGLWPEENTATSIRTEHFVSVLVPTHFKTRSRPHGSFSSNDRLSVE